jgi:tetratricopeptide (TPR) repeat protein
MNPAKNGLTMERLSKIPVWIYLCLILLLVCLSYINTLYSPFVLDDFHSFVENPNVYAQDISFASLQELSSTVFGKARLIPLISFAVDNYLAAGHIMQYHITNLLIHLLATLAFFYLIKGLLATGTGTRSLKFLSPGAFCLLSAALWALNPVQTNGVTYLVQRMTSMATLFYLSGLAFYTFARLTPSRRKKGLLFLCAAIAALLAFLSKENSYTLPVAVLMIEGFFLSPGKVTGYLKSVKKHHWLLIILLAALLLPLTENYLQKILNGYNIRYFTLSERLLTELRVVVFYMSLLILPLPGRLNLEHDFPISTSFITPTSTFLSLALLVCLFIMAVRVRRSLPLISFGVLWFFLNLSIESSFVPLEIIFEHRLYLSSMGFVIAVISFLDIASSRLESLFPAGDYKKMLACFAVMLICVLSILTTLRNNDWRDAVTFHADCVKKSPNKARPFNDLGVSLSKAGRHEEALAVFDKAMDNDMGYGLEYLKIANNVMIVMAEMQKIEEGIAKGEKYIRDSPAKLFMTKQEYFLYNLGVLYKTTGRYENAFDAFKSSLITDSNFQAAASAMENLLLQNYNNADAREALGLQETDKDPQMAVRLRMAEIMLDVRAYGKALNYLAGDDRKVHINSYNNELVNRYRTETEKNLARRRDADINNHDPYKDIFLYRFSFKSANFIKNNYSPLSFFIDRLLKKIEELAPNDPFVALYVSRRLLSKEKPVQALAVLEKNIQIHPDFIPNLDLQAKILLMLGYEDKMAEVITHTLDIYPGHPKWKNYRKAIKAYAKKQA